MSDVQDHLAKFLILGLSGVGKTHYGAQLLARLNHNTGSLRMRGAASNIRPFEAALECLSEGKAADHTPTKAYEMSRWPVVNRRGQSIDLIWPDYGGEQLRLMLEARRVPSDWRERLADANGWILFLRPQHTEVKDDVFSRPLSNLDGTGKVKAAFVLSDQAKMVELLQLLLFTRGVGTLNRISSPALTVLLTCWDELGVPSPSTPLDILASRMPLVSEFILSSWRSEQLTVYGLSALGKPLKVNEGDEDYLNRGPEHFGFVINSEGSQDTDLTLPIADLASKVV